MAEGRVIRIDWTPVGTDSMRIQFTGQRYTGPTDRPGVIVEGPDAWAPITNGDGAATLVRHAPTQLLRAIQARADSNRSKNNASSVTTDSVVKFLPGSHTRDTLLRDLPQDRKAFCRANVVRNDRLLIIDVVTMSDWCTLSPAETENYSGNTYFLEDPANVPVGNTIDICAISGIPHGFEVVEWFPDPKHCPFDPYWQWKREPNRVRVRRVE